MIDGGTFYTRGIRNLVCPYRICGSGTASGNFAIRFPGGSSRRARATFDFPHAWLAPPSANGRTTVTSSPCEVLSTQCRVVSDIYPTSRHVDMISLYQLSTVFIRVGAKNTDHSATVSDTGVFRKLANSWLDPFLNSSISKSKGRTKFVMGLFTIKDHTLNVPLCIS